MLTAGIGLIALDLDGTLLDARDGISTRNRRALRAAVAAGVQIVFVTGRSPEDVPYAAIDEFAQGLPAICAHGAMTLARTGEVLECTTIAIADALALIDAAEQHDLRPAVYVDGEFLHLPGELPAFDIGGSARWRAVESIAVALGAREPAMLRCFAPRAFERLRAIADRGSLCVRHEVWDSFEECAVTHASATKERALARLCVNLEVPRERVMAIGDSRNDLPMLRWAGIGVAMGNAAHDVRASADAVTEHCDRDGVAIAIERFVLTPPSGRAIA